MDTPFVETLLVLPDRWTTWHDTIVTTGITNRTKILSELFPAILDRIIAGQYSKRINLIVIRAHYRNHLAVHRSHDTWTENSVNKILQ